MKKQVLATIIGTMAAITSVTAKADVTITTPNFYSNRSYDPGNARVVCTLTQLNPAGGPALSKTTLESPPRFRETTLEFKNKDSETVASVDLREGDDSVSIIMNVGWLREFEGWVRAGNSVSLREPADNMTMDCTVNNLAPTVRDQVRALVMNPPHGYGWHGGERSGQQWTVGQTSVIGQGAVEASFSVQSGVFAEDKVIDFESHGIIIGYQVNSGYGPDSTTNGNWQEEEYTNSKGGVGSSKIRLRFSNQPMRKMSYRVSVFFLRYPLQ